MCSWNKKPCQPRKGKPRVIISHEISCLKMFWFHIAWQLSVCVLITVIRPAALSIFVLESSSGLLSMTFRERPTRERLSQIHRAGKWWAKTKDCITMESARCRESRFVWRIFLINRHGSILRSSINCFRNFFRLAAWWFITTANNQSFQRLREHF